MVARDSLIQVKDETSSKKSSDSYRSYRAKSAKVSMNKDCYPNFNQQRMFLNHSQGFIKSSLVIQKLSDRFSGINKVK